jgi:hypothetical protein
MCSRVYFGDSASFSGKWQFGSWPASLIGFEWAAHFKTQLVALLQRGTVEQSIYFTLGSILGGQASLVMTLVLIVLLIVTYLGTGRWTGPGCGRGRKFAANALEISIGLLSVGFTAMTLVQAAKVLVGR